MLFANLGKRSKNRHLFLGSPEAEAESLESSRVKLTEVYEDWHDLFSQLSNEKFIVVGSKGAGKSAFAQYTYAKSLEESNIFVDFVKQDKTNLEKLVQIGLKKGHDLEREAIFKWLIYTHIVRLFTTSEAAKDNSNYDQLRQFLRKNTGFVDITETEIKEFSQNKSFEVHVEPLRRFFRKSIKKDFSIKSERAPFYKLIPHLEEVIISILQSQTERINKNSYIIFFDDLDIGFNISVTSSVDNVVSLLRVAKSINNDFFSRNSVNAKVVILLRDDVEKHIVDIYPDTAKMMASYSANIKWYQDDFQRGDNENDLNIKKFINHRIKKSFEISSLPCNQSDPWKSLVNTEEDYDKKTSFKYVLDHTLFRPRDLLLLFLPLQDGKMSVPLSKPDVNSLIATYSVQLIKEFKNEISSFYEPKEIIQLTKVLKIINKEGGCSYNSAMAFLNENYKFDKDKSEILDDLFDRSVIDNRNSPTNFKFKYREPIDGSEIYSLNRKGDIVIHYGFRAYFTSQDS